MHSRPRLIAWLGLVGSTLTASAGASGQSAADPASASSGSVGYASAPEADVARDPIGESPELKWNPGWVEFQTWEYFFTGAMVATAFGSLAIPGRGGWRSENSFDREARDFFRPDTQLGRDRARDVSDIGLVLLANQLTLDALVIPWWYYDNPDIAFQLSAMSIEALAFNAAMNGVVAGLTSRRRPYVEDECFQLEQEDLPADCTGLRRYRSFFSGHASTAFTAAGLVCQHHAQLSLYGGGFADGLACGFSVAAAGTVATMRVVGDQHWVSDILVGSAFGFANGLGMPYLLHYAGGVDQEELGERDPNDVTFSVVPTPTGGMITGQF